VVKSRRAREAALEPVTLTLSLLVTRLERRFARPT